MTMEVRDFMATNCQELLKIGYTLNGFYLVKGNSTINKTNIEIVDCIFKHPNGSKEGKIIFKRYFR